MIRINTTKDLRIAPATLFGDGLGAIPEDLRHLYLTNPSLGGIDGSPVQILGLKGDEVVGRINLVFGRICVEGEDVPILWGSAFKVPPNHRSSGLGAMIVLTMQNLPYAVGAVGASQMALPLYQRLNWIDFKIPRFVLLRHCRPVLQRRFGSGLLPSAAIAVGDLFLAAAVHRVARRIRMATRSLSVKEMMHMPDELDSQVRRIDKPASCLRSVAWINWILSLQKGTPGLFLVKDGQGRTVGYFVITHRSHKEGIGLYEDFILGSVKDWMTFDSSAVTDTQLVFLAINQLMRRSVDVVEVCVAEPEVGLALCRHGLKRLDDLHFTFRPLPDSPLAKPTYHHIEVWRIRPADGDYFTF
jgi:hypothetical protein